MIIIIICELGALKEKSGAEMAPGWSRFPKQLQGGVILAPLFFSVSNRATATGCYQIEIFRLCLLQASVENLSISPD